MWETKKRPGSPEADDKRIGGGNNNNHSNNNGSIKRPKLDKDALLARVREKSRAVQDKLSSIKAQKSEEKDIKRDEKQDIKQEHTKPAPAEKPGIGLNVPLHPLFNELKSNEHDNATTQAHTQTHAQSQTPQKNKYLEELLSDDGSKPASNILANPYVDSSIELGGASKLARRARRGLIFNPKGKYIEQAEKLRREQQLQELKKKLEEKKKSVGLETDLLADERNYKPEKPPGIEWWDKELLTDPNAITSYDTAEINFGGAGTAITLYIQHPIPLAPPWEKNMPKETKLHLTKKEFKRIRKLGRSEKHKEIQDRIRLGLDPAPPPKIKPSNVMNIFTTESIKDPTLLEQKAKEAVAQRRQKHELDNLERKLTPEEQYNKFVAKLEKEKEKGLYTAVFRVEILKDGRHKFLVNYNAKKLQLTGIVVFNPKFCLIIVEGGFLAVKKFTRLLMVRMKWTENAPPKEGQSQTDLLPLPDLSKNKCSLVWSGQLKDNKFKKWSLHDADTEQDAKDLLSRHGAENYWLEARVLDQGHDTTS